MASMIVSTSAMLAINPVIARDSSPVTRRFRYRIAAIVVAGFVLGLFVIVILRIFRGRR
jgi:hypothetical protein